jgi:hypothetical protein
MGATGTRDFIAVGRQIIKRRHIVINDDVAAAVAGVVVSVVAKGQGAVQPIVEQVYFRKSRQCGQLRRNGSRKSISFQVQLQ